MAMPDLTCMSCTVDDGLARIVFTQAERGNPIDGVFCRELRDLAVELSCRADVRAVLIQAQGRFFSVGGDIRSFVGDRAALPGIIKAWTGDIHSAIARFQRMNAPVVVAVHGDVAGGSVSLAAMADVLYAVEGVKFNAAFSLIGYSCDSGSSITLSTRMGIARAKRFLMLSEVLDAAQAREAGLVDHVVAADALAGEAEKMARRLAAGPTLAYGNIKRLMLSARTQPLESQLEDEAQALAAAASSDDAWEGLMAFTERRKPAFKGR